jgi:preprotein translocase subunit SecD
VVCLFMLIYYRFMGIFSTIGVALYIIFMVAIIKVSTIIPGLGITLTMGGVAGLILSIGMSMETDVLIFERIREEIRGGRSFAHSWLLGFKRAWTSIRDSNVVSMIIAIILATWGTGMVKGFAIVLALGIVVGLLTTFLGTRALIELVANMKFTKNNWLFNVEKEDKK